MTGMKVLHKYCGGQVGWYVGNTPRAAGVAKSSEFIRMDGSHPMAGSVMREKCSKCGEIVRAAGDMYIDIEEVPVVSEPADPNIVCTPKSEIKQ